MNLKRMLVATTAAAGIGAAGLFGLGIGTASADPGQCGPNGQWCNNNGPNNGHDNNWNNGPNNGPDNGPNNNWNNGPADWQHRNVDQARQDHQPFNWNGQWVQPMPAGNGPGWGFWFLGQWIPL